LAMYSTAKGGSEYGQKIMSEKRYLNDWQLDEKFDGKTI